MDNFRIVCIKCEDDKVLVEKLKEIMKTYDMDLVEFAGNKYKFDRDGDYSRSFTIKKAENGWITVHDEDEAQAESLCMELSSLANTFAIYMYIYKDLLCYSAFESGEQIDQYMSTYDYYEYPVDENVVNTYKGNTEAFASIIGLEQADKLQIVLEDCRQQDIEPLDACRIIYSLFGMTENNEVNELEESDDTEEELDQVIDMNDIFYVDFESINVRTESQQKVIDAVSEIVGELGFVRVDGFSDSSTQKGGFFKKIMSSVAENKRIHFFISPFSNGWVTLVGEMEVLYGRNPSEWSFMNIEDRLSEILNSEVVNIYGKNETWGFKVSKDGKTVLIYDSDVEIESIDNIAGTFKNIKPEILEDIFNREVNSAEDVDDIMREFTDTLEIINYKINIPMDYSEEEFYKNVLNGLPDGKDFLNIKFEKKK